MALKSIAFNFADWHGDVGCARVLVPGVGGIGVKLGCLSCGCLVDVEALGTRMEVQLTYLTGADLLAIAGGVAE